MIEEGDLAINLLDFRQKSFQFERLVDRADGPYAIFVRTETETESQLRPKLVHLHLVVPQEWLVYDAELDLLRLGREGAPPAPRSPGIAVESAAEPSEFREQAFDWLREQPAEHVYVYLPKERQAALGPGIAREVAGPA